jgi:hypothetical protein
MKPCVIRYQHRWFVLAVTTISLCELLSSCLKKPAPVVAPFVLLIASYKSRSETLVVGFLLPKMAINAHICVTAWESSACKCRTKHATTTTTAAGRH